MNEIFVDITNYEGLYKVSNTGKVFSVISNRVLKTVKRKSSQTSYEYLTLVKNKVKKTHVVHRLVASAFIENPENKPCVNHIDNNGLNNQVNNLEWCTYSENLLHAQSQGRLYEAQSKGGVVSSKKAQDNALLDATEMIGKTYQNWKIIECVGLKPVGNKGIERYFFTCKCASCENVTELSRDYVKSLNKHQCRSCDALNKTQKRYEQAQKELVNAVIGTWTVTEITKPKTVMRSCQICMTCTVCGNSIRKPYAEYPNIATQKCRYCR